MFNLDTEQIVQQASVVDTRETLRAKAMKALYDNQECFVAQWIIQNPFENPADYTLRFTYNDKSLNGYDVTMEKIKNV